MAEALGVAASIAGLITIADIVVRRGYEFIKLVKGAGETVEKVISEVNWLFGMLHSLQNVARRLEGEGQTLDPTMQINWIEPCYRTLSNIQDFLQKAMAGDSMTRMEKIKWPLRQSATLELLKDLERHKSNITLAVNAKEMSALCDIRDGVQSLRAAIDSQRTVQNQIILDDERRKMLSILGDISARKWQDSNIRLRQPGTGIWFTEGAEFEDWLRQDRSKLWINGIPGAGKTVLMSSTIQKIELGLKSTEALTFFYCDYKDSSTHSASTILGSLARQLIMRHEDCLDTLTAFYEDHVSPDRSVRDPSPEELCQLISKLSTHFTNVMIVVDGLDEITHGRAEVSNFLASLHTNSSLIKTLFSSRPEVDIGHVLKGFQTISIAAQSSDIRLYIASEIERRTADMRLEINDLTLKEHIMTTLADRCDGMFRWVACQMDYLCECSNDRDRREALTKLPPDLPSSYERILERVNRSANKGNRTLVVKALHWISYAHNDRYYGYHFTNKHLLQALAVHEGDDNFDSGRVTTEQRLLHWCSSLVRKNPTSGRIELAHFTVEEFLIAIDPLGSPLLSKYRLSGDHSILAMACLEVLRCETFDGKPFPHILAMDDDIDEPVGDFCGQYPFFQYAVTWWSYHVHRSEPKDIDQAVFELLTVRNGPSLRRILIVLYYLDSESRPKAAKKYRVAAGAVGSQNDALNFLTVENHNLWPSPLHWAACYSLDRICQRLIDNGTDINKYSFFGTPLYCSMFSSYFSSEAQVLWPDFVVSFCDNLNRNEAPERDAFKVILDAGAYLDISSSPDGVDAPLDFAIQIVAQPEVEASSFSYFLIELLRSGAQVSANILDFIASDSVKDQFSNELYVGVDEIIWAFIEAAVRTEWRFWELEHLLHMLGITLSPDWVYAADHIERLEAAVAESFQDARASELQFMLHNEDEQISTRLAKTILRTIEWSCGSSEAFNLKMFKVLAQLRALIRIDLPVCCTLLSLCPGINVALKDKKKGRTLMHIFLYGEKDHDPSDTTDIESFLKILLRRGASVTSLDNEQVSALEIAARFYQLKVFELLWKSPSFVEIRQTSDDLVNSVLYAAMLRQDTELIDFLLREMISGPQSSCATSMASEFRKNDTANLDIIFNEHSKIPQLRAIALSSLHHAARPEVSFEIFDFIFSTWRIPNSQDAIGNTPVHCLVTKHDITYMAKLQLLVQSGASIDDLNRNGFTPLALAVRCKNVAATKMLLVAGTDPNLLLTQGQTALHLAACLGNTEAVELLLAKGCYRKIKDDSGRTPGELALAYGYNAISNMIREATTEDDGLDGTELKSNDKVVPRNSDLHDPHGKLPLRIVDRNSGCCTPPSNRASGIAQGNKLRNWPDGIEALIMVSSETPHSEVEQEAIAHSTSSNSAISEYSSMRIFEHERTVASKRSFQSLDPAFLDPTSKKARQA